MAFKMTQKVVIGMSNIGVDFTEKQIEQIGEELREYGFNVHVQVYGDLKPVEQQFTDDLTACYFLQILSKISNQYV